MTKPKILITGASGYVGAYVYKYLKDKGLDVIGTYHSNQLFDELIQLDITNKEAVSKVIGKINPNIIIHIAAEAHTQSSEQDPEGAYKLNVEATKYIVDIAKEKNIRLIYQSTFACYNPPTTVYAKTKLQGEELVKTHANYLIIRASLIIGVSPNTVSKNFFNDLLTAIKNKKSMEADTSWKFETTYLGHLAKIYEKIINNANIKQLTIPVTVKGSTSRFEITKLLLEDYGLKAIKIDQNRILPEPVLDLSAYDTFDLNRPAFRECIDKIKAELSTL